MDLETVLKSIPWTQDFTSTFQATLGDKIITISTPVYAAPAKMMEQKLHLGVNLLAAGLRYVPIGLSQTKNFSTTHYHFTKQQRWEIAEKQRHDLWYLALEKLPLQMDIKNKNKGLQNSAVTVYTLQGLAYPFPFILLEEES